MSEAKIKCEHCGDLSDRLFRSNSGEKWTCPPCYIGFNCFPTPQTKWAAEEIAKLKAERVRPEKPKKWAVRGPLTKEMMEYITANTVNLKNLSGQNPDWYVFNEESKEWVAGLHIRDEDATILNTKEWLDIFT